MTAAPFDPAAMTLDDYLDFYRTRGYGYTLKRGVRPALVIIDFSIAFTRGTENFPGGGYDAEVAEAARLLAAARAAGIPVIHTTIAYDDHLAEAPVWAAKIPWIAGLKAGTREVEIDPRLEPAADETVLVKKFPSCFFATDLHERLQAQGVDTLILAGCTTSFCVRATTVDAMGLGYPTLLAREAIGDITPALTAVHMADLGARYADVVGVDEVIAWLDGLPGG